MIDFDCAVEVTLGEIVLVELEGSLSGAGARGVVAAIETENFDILIERLVLIAGTHEEGSDFEAKSGIGRQRLSHGEQLGSRLRQSILSEKESNQFEAGVSAVGIGILIPNAVNGVVVVANGVFQVMSARGQPGKGEIDRAVLGSALPQAQQISL